MDTQKLYKLQHVNVVIYPGFKALEAVGTISVFEYANAKLATLGLPPAYDVQLCAPEAGMIRSDTKIVLEAPRSLNSMLLPDVALIVGARDIDQALAEQSSLVQWCQMAASRNTTLLGVCSGAFFLAEAGLLDRRKATTHWSVSRKLSERYPRIEVVEDAIFIHDDRIWTSAGVTAVLDLTLAYVEKDLGRDIALSVARDLVVYLKRPGGQSQFSEHLNSQMTQHSGVRKLQEWILTNLHLDLSHDDLSARAAMSPRNFGRVFVREVGCSPTTFIERARVELARRLLEDGKVPLKLIATRCGFRSDDQFRRVFQKHCGITPKAYQERFGLPLHSPQ